MDVKLVMFKHDGQRKDFPISGKDVTIGRGQECGLRVPLLSVSRMHCELTKGQDEVRVKDLASSNGTYVNNRRITEAVLKAGDRLTVGPVILTVQINGAPEQITPVKTPTELAAEISVPAPAAAEEEIVELEADTAEVVGIEDSDPISALEALAAESEEEEKEQ